MGDRIKNDDLILAKLVILGSSKFIYLILSNEDTVPIIRYKSNNKHDKIFHLSLFLIMILFIMSLYYTPAAAIKDLDTAP